MGKTAPAVCLVVFPQLGFQDWSVLWLSHGSRGSVCHGPGITSQSLLGSVLVGNGSVSGVPRQVLGCRKSVGRVLGSGIKVWKRRLSLDKDRGLLNWGDNIMSSQVLGSIPSIIISQGGRGKGRGEGFLVVVKAGTRARHPPFQ